MIKRIFIAAFALVLVTGLFSCSSEKERLANRIAKGEQQLLNDSTKMLNPDIAKKVMKDYLDYVSQYKADSLAPGYLFKAADLANGLQQPKEAIRLYEQLLREYPDFKKAPSALFMIGFIYDTILQDKDKAKEIYSQFLIKYPQHPLAQAAQASKDQITAGLTDDDLVKMFEAKNKK